MHSDWLLNIFSQSEYSKNVFISSGPCAARAEMNILKHFKPFFGLKSFSIKMHLFVHIYLDKTKMIMDECPIPIPIPINNHIDRFRI